MEEDYLQEYKGEPYEMYEHHRITADKGQGLVRLDKFLMDRLEHATRNKLQEAMKAGHVLVNGNTVKPSYKVKPGDEIKVFLEKPKRNIEIFPEDLPLDIRYEDPDVVVVHKEAGMVVHPAYGNYSGTLLNAMKHYLQNNEPEAKPLMVHRIDKNTTGLMLMAKHEQAQSCLAKQFYDHNTKRNYIALVWGDIKDNEGTITGNLGRSKKDRKVMTVYPKGDHGKHAVTHYKVLERFGYVTAVECELETGRTHQIRAHMKYIGHPLFNDQTYGGDRIRKGTSFSKYKQFIDNAFKLCPRQALHAKTLGFKQPTTGAWIQLESNIPQDMKQVMDKWRTYAQASINSKQNPQTL
ncbi:MAG: RluA family pseudouridine synthase [Bacteroidales bacterium]